MTETTPKPLRSVVPTPAIAPPTGVWSNAMIASPGRLLFVSGMLPIDRQGNTVGAGDMAAQTEQVVRNVQAAVEAAGGTLRDLVRVDVYATDVTRFQEIHEVRRRHFPEEPPTSTMVEIVRLIREDCLIEISAIAVLP